MNERKMIVEKVPLEGTIFLVEVKEGRQLTSLLQLKLVVRLESVVVRCRKVFSKVKKHFRSVVLESVAY